MTSSKIRITNDNGNKAARTSSGKKLSMKKERIAKSSSNTKTDTAAKKVMAARLGRGKGRGRGCVTDKNVEKRILSMNNFLQAAAKSSSASVLRIPTLCGRRIKIHIPDPCCWRGGSLYSCRSDGDLNWQEGR